jgi:hypothetical protein
MREAHRTDRTMTARLLHMAPEYYDEKAQQCQRLLRQCLDPSAVEALKKLAREYDLMARTLRTKQTASIAAGD